ncbi:MAG: GIY-YIG nuclease family protein [Flavobacteriales bacterium]|jgi:putative endonuclease
MAGYMYILLCRNNTYYTGSTKFLLTRYQQHLDGEGANYTRKHPPVAIVYFEKYFGVDTAFYREKQVQKWSQAKKLALIEGRLGNLHALAECQNATHCKNFNPEKMAMEDPDMVE